VTHPYGSTIAETGGVAAPLLVQLLDLTSQTVRLACMKSMPTVELRKLLRSLGCEYSGTVGSHEKWTAPGGHSTTLKAAVKAQAPGTLRSIQAALAAEFGPDWIEKRRQR